MNILNYMTTLICVGTPVFLLLRKQHNFLVFWLGFSAFVEILNSMNFVTITPTRMAGIVLIPFVLKRCRGVLESLPGKLLFASLSLMFVLGVFYGYLFPWIDVTGERTFRYIAQGRSVIYFGGFLLEMIVAVYLALQLRDSKKFKFLIAGFLAGASFSAVGVWFEKLFHYDFYYGLTQWDFRPLSSRPRGFNYEPRGAGYSATVGLLAILIPYRQLSEKLRYLLIPLIAYGFHLAASVSAIFLLLMAVITLGIFHQISVKSFHNCDSPGPEGDYSKKARTLFWRRVLAICASFALFQLLLPSYPPDVEDPTQNAWEYSLLSKNNAYFQKDSWLGRFEVFDSMALSFFAHNPRHLLLGTGPGLIGLPVSTRGLRIDSIPHIGAVLMLSNYGLLGMALWIAMNVLIFKTLFALWQKKRESFEAPLTLFTCLAGMYFLQYKIFYVFGLGLGLSIFVLDKPKVNQGAGVSG